MSQKRVRALILDYGGVISKPQAPENVNNILRILNQDHDSFREAYRRQRGPYDRGEITGEQYWIDILHHYGLDPHGYDIARLIQEDVESWTQMDEAMIQFIPLARRKAHKLAMISNMTRDTLSFLKTRCTWLELFDALCFSCDLGINKPDRRIYETCLRGLDIGAEECLFVDDSAKNVAGARESGLHAIQYKTFAEFVQELEEKFRPER